MKKVIFILIMALTVLGITSCDENTSTGVYNPGVYYAVDQQTKVSAHIVISELGNIENVMFDQQYGNTTLYTLGDDYELESGHSWKDEAHYLASYLEDHQGWDGIEFNTTDITGMTALTAPDYFIELNYDLSNNDIDYVTLPIDGFVLSWNEAIKKASNNDTGVVSDIPTSLQWLEANKPPFDYANGIFYGVDDAHGYIVRVVIEEGYITDVVFDAITALNTRIVWNDNNTPGDTSDDYPEVEIISMNTKQGLADELVLVSGTVWSVEAEMMKEAIIDKQCWNSVWQFTVSGSHEYFDFSDSVTVDSVAGVTLAIEGFRLVFEQAINKAIIE